MTRAAVLFPGQGNLPADLSSRLEREDPELHELVIRRAGAEVFDRADEQQRWRQPALFAASMGCWRTIELAIDAGDLPFERDNIVAFAGHSLGEVAALVAAGRLLPADAVELVCLRGTIFDEIAEHGRPAAMCAIVGDDPLEFAHTHVSDEVFIANDNSPNQIVICGDSDAIRAVRGHARSAGLRAVMLPIGVAAHSSWMEPLTEPLTAQLAGFEIADASVPVWSSTLAAPFDDVRAGLVSGCTSPVRWRELVIALADAGVDLMVDVGPGHVLAAQATKTLGPAVDVMAPCNE